MVHEPHSPTPYLLRRAASFKDMTLADMITTFVDDEWQRTNLLKLMGIDLAENNQKKINFLKSGFESQISNIHKNSC